MTVQQDLDEIFTTARTAVTRAGEAVVSARQLEPLTISSKAPRDLVTNADIEADRIIAREAGCLATQYQELAEQSDIPADLHAKRLLVANKTLFSKLQDLLLS